MYTLLIGAVLSAFTFTPIAAAPTLESRADGLAGSLRASNLRFRIRGNDTGITKVDGKLLGATNQPNAFTGFSLPYGQTPQVFTLDDKTSYVYAAKTSAGKQLLLSAVPQANKTASVETAVAGSKGSLPIECSSVGVAPRQILCGVNVNGTLYNKLLVIDYKKDGNYELAIGASAGGNPQVALNVEPV